MNGLSEILHGFCYSLEDDAWNTDGRQTYAHDENASKVYLKELGIALAREGFRPHPIKLRAFVCPETGEIIEIEPGGSDCTGHLLHGTRAAANAGAPSVLIAYGEDDADKLQRCGIAGQFLRLPSPICGDQP